MIISVDTETATDKIQHPFLVKTLSKLGIAGNFLNLIRAFMKNQCLTNIILNGEGLKGFLHDQEKKRMSDLGTSTQNQRI